MTIASDEVPEVGDELHIHGVPGNGEGGYVIEVLTAWEVPEGWVEVVGRRKR